MKEFTITLKEFYEKSPSELYDSHLENWGEGGCASYKVKVKDDDSFSCLIPPSKLEKKFYCNDGERHVPFQFKKSYRSLYSMCRNISLNGAKYCVRCGRKAKNYQRWFGDVYCNKCWRPKDQELRDWDYSHLD